MRHDGENTLRALRRALPLQRKSLAKKALAGRWRLENSRDGPYYVLEYTPHYLVLGGLRDKICSSLQLGNVNCMNARYIAMLRDPAKRAFSQYVMKTHMRVALYNDRRTFWKAVTDGMKHTADYSKCWDDALGLSTNESSAHEVAWTRAERSATWRPAGAPYQLPGNLFQAYVLKSAYYYQLLPWFAHFPSRVYVDVLERFDDAAIQRMVAWLELPYVGENGYKDQEAVVALAGAKRNVARDGGVSALSEEHAAALDDFFRPRNRKLDLLLGRPTGYPVYRVYGLLEDAVGGDRATRRGALSLDGGPGGLRAVCVIEHGKTWLHFIYVLQNSSAPHKNFCHQCPPHIPLRVAALRFIRRVAQPQAPEPPRTSVIFVRRRPVRRQLPPWNILIFYRPSITLIIPVRARFTHS